MPVFQNLKLPLGKSLEEKLKELDPRHLSYRVLKKSLDARKKKNLHFVYTVETFAEATPPPLSEQTIEKVPEGTKQHCCIIGAGPAGLLAALRLVKRGISCEVFERGKALSPRMRDISTHWRKGVIIEDSNVCFGEGGAGTFSDGKLITRIKSPHKNSIMQDFVRFGAPESILSDANPHVGSNKIRGIIHNLVKYLEDNGCPVRFDSKVKDFIFEEGRLAKVLLADGKEVVADSYILATGHSAHDVYEKLLAANIPCEAKSMAMGFRVEHPQEWVNKTQYGKRWEHPELPVANYKLSDHDKENDVGVYSFCMCPGGYVLPSSAQKNRMVVNGMSNFNHGSPYANSGIVVSIDKDKWYDNDPKKALEFQENIEKRCQDLVAKAGGSREVPAQRVIDFLNNETGPVAKSSCPSGVIAANLRKIYPKRINEALCVALKNFEKKMPGFLAKDAILHGVESRTSSPIRILRKPDTLSSPAASNFYPCGEGAGYAGGITSAGVDGIRVAEAIYTRYLFQRNY